MTIAVEIWKEGFACAIIDLRERPLVRLQKSIASRGHVMTSNKSNAVIVALKRTVAQSSDLGTVRRIVETSINAIYPLYYPCHVVQFFLDHHTPDRILTDIDAGCVCIFETDSTIVGTGTVHGNEITRVFVLPEYQGRGYGSAIMKQLEDIVFRLHRIVKLDSSLPAFGMYLKRGYKSCAWQKIVTPGGQVLCYHEMEKENVQASCDSSSGASGLEEEQ